jgi:hypothetical protein
MIIRLHIILVSVDETNGIPDSVLLWEFDYGYDNQYFTLVVKELSIHRKQKALSK